MAEKRGIEETKELLDFIFSLVQAIKESTKDGESQEGASQYWELSIPVSS